MQYRMHYSSISALKESINLMCVCLCLYVGPSGGRKHRQRRSSGHRRMLTWTRPSVISWTMAPFSTRLSRRTGQSSILVGGVGHSITDIYIPFILRCCTYRLDLALFPSPHALFTLVVGLVICVMHRVIG